MDTQLKTAAGWIRASRKTIAFTGAGVSTESGIPDFRSPTGLWTQFSPFEYATLGAFKADPLKVWRMIAELEKLLDAQPNPGHRALAELESKGLLQGIITQNIDGLHQAAGNQVVVEYHGSHRTFSCLSCGANYARAALEGQTLPPRCTARVSDRVCGAVLKPDVVLFDELIPQAALEGAQQLVQGAELVLVIGTSCEVYPAAAIPGMVQRGGGRVIELNLEPAPILADLRLSGPFSQVMPALVAEVVGS